MVQYKRILMILKWMILMKIKIENEDDGTINGLLLSRNKQMKRSTVLKLKNISCEFYINYRKIRLIYIIFCKLSEFYFCKST
jgi:hypothetical protein